MSNSPATITFTPPMLSAHSNASLHAELDQLAALSSDQDGIRALRQRIADPKFATTHNKLVQALDTAYDIAQRADPSLVREGSPAEQVRRLSTYLDHPLAAADKLALREAVRSARGVAHHTPWKNAAAAIEAGFAAHAEALNHPINPLDTLFGELAPRRPAPPTPEALAAELAKTEEELRAIAETIAPNRTTPAATEDIGAVLKAAAENAKGRKPFAVPLPPAKPVFPTAPRQPQAFPPPAAEGLSATPEPFAPTRKPQAFPVSSTDNPGSPSRLSFSASGGEPHVHGPGCGHDHHALKYNPKPSAGTAPSAGGGSTGRYSFERSASHSGASVEKEVEKAASSNRMAFALVGAVALLGTWLLSQRGRDPYDKANGQGR